VLGFGA